MNRTAKGSMIVLSLLVGVLPVAAQRSARPDRLQSLVDTERAFSRTSEEKGIREAFTAFIADNGILFRPRAVKGKEWMQQHPLPASKTRPLLTWQPVFAAISRGGDLGYTTGPWQYKNDIKDKKPSAFGNFMTVWKKQVDGSWKFVLDLGISHLQPKTQTPTWQPRVSAESNNFRRVNIEATRAQLLSMEKDFSDASAGRGAVEAFLAHAEKDVRLYRENHEVFVGKKAAATGLTPLATQWTWTPEFADVSISGDLGYSYGSYDLREKSSAKIIESGNYARVWKKEQGVWKVVIDVANPVPPQQ